jgi:hypothetical protein
MTIQNNSLILNLESSIKEYDTLSIQYNQVQNDYINYLQKNNLTQSQNKLNLSNVQNVAFWGTTGISSSNVSSIDQCSALCSSTPGCSGATFNITNNGGNNCWLRSGDGPIITGTSDQFAIIPKTKKFLLTLQTLNSQLIDANNKILQKFTQFNNFTQQDDEKSEKYILLKQNYANLESQRQTILKQLEEQQTIQEKKIQGGLIVTKNYYNYILFLFIVILCLLILSKTSIDSLTQSGLPGNNNNSLTILFTILFLIILIFIISYFYNKIFR